jgi:hypothetical protein
MNDLRSFKSVLIMQNKPRSCSKNSIRLYFEQKMLLRSAQDFPNAEFLPVICNCSAAATIPIGEAW